jgi:hypothetical protein
LRFATVLQAGNPYGLESCPSEYLLLTACNPTISKIYIAETAISTATTVHSTSKVL